MPGLGLKRGLGGRPGGRALRDRARRAGRRRSSRRATCSASPSAGSRARYGFYEAIDYTPRKGDDAAGATAAARRDRGARLPRPPPGHDARRARATCCAATAMVRRFHADPRVQATELLLQERVPAPRRRSRSRGRPRRRAWRRRRGRCSTRRFRSPHTAHPHAHFLSNGAYTVIVTNAGGGASLWRGRAVTRLREDATRDPGGIFLYLRDVRERRRLVGRVPARRAASRTDYVATFLPEKAFFHGRGPRHRDAARDRGLARGRRRGAPRHRSRTAARAAARDRGHELRRDRARPARGRPRASGVRQALRRDRATCRRATRSSAHRRPRRAGGRRRSAASTC